jgi:hypothetical protein
MPSVGRQERAMPHDEGYKQMLELKAICKAIVKWIEDNPHAMTDDNGLRNLLELARELADKYENV